MGDMLKELAESWKLACLYHPIQIWTLGSFPFSVMEFLTESGSKMAGAIG
jgi:hypothetical protein